MRPFLIRLSSSGKILWVEDRFCKLMGYEQDEIYQKNFSDILHHEDACELSKDLFYVMNTDERFIFSATVRLNPKNKKSFPVKFSKKGFFVEVQPSLISIQENLYEPHAL